MSEAAATRSRAVVIGYGSRLRGDDGVGPRVASAVARRRPDVRTLRVHQLTPELAAVLAEADVGVFVDARADGGGEIGVHPVEPAVSAPALDHVLMPGAVLAVAAARYGRCPRAWAVSVPVATFAFGDRLSSTARVAAATALGVVEPLLPRAGEAPVHPAVADAAHA